MPKSINFDGCPVKSYRFWRQGQLAVWGYLATDRGPEYDYMEQEACAFDFLAEGVLKSYNIKQALFALLSAREIGRIGAFSSVRRLPRDLIHEVSKLMY